VDGRHNRNRSGGIPGLTGRQNAFSDEHVDLHPDQFGRHVTKFLGTSIGETQFQGDVLAFHITLVAKPLPEGLEGRHRECHR